MLEGKIVKMNFSHIFRIKYMGRYVNNNTLCALFQTYIPFGCESFECYLKYDISNFFRLLITFIIGMWQKKAESVQLRRSFIYHTSYHI